MLAQEIVSLKKILEESNVSPKKKEKSIVFIAIAMLCLLVISVLAIAYITMDKKDKKTIESVETITFESDEFSADSIVQAISGRPPKSTRFFPGIDLEPPRAGIRPRTFVKSMFPSLD